jgi:hypothetical protein
VDGKAIMYKLGKGTLWIVLLDVWETEHGSCMVHWTLWGETENNGIGNDSSIVIIVLMVIVAVVSEAMDTNVTEKHAGHTYASLVQNTMPMRTRTSVDTPIFLSRSHDAQLN